LRALMGCGSIHRLIEHHELRRKHSEGKQSGMDMSGPEQQNSELPRALNSAAAGSAERALRLARISLVLAILALTFGIVAALLR